MYVGIILKWLEICYKFWCWIFGSLFCFVYFMFDGILCGNYKVKKSVGSRNFLIVNF